MSKGSYLLKMTDTCNLFTGRNGLLPNLNKLIKGKSVLQHHPPILGEGCQSFELILQLIHPRSEHFDMALIKILAADESFALLGQSFDKLCHDIHLEVK